MVYPQTFSCCEPQARNPTPAGQSRCGTCLVGLLRTTLHYASYPSIEQGSGKKKPSLPNAEQVGCKYAENMQLGKLLSYLILPYLLFAAY